MSQRADYLRTNQQRVIDWLEMPTRSLNPLHKEQQQMEVGSGAQLDPRKDFDVIGLDHVGFSVSSLNAALRFWVDGMGATVIRKGTLSSSALAEVTGAKGAEARTAMIELSGQQIELLELSGAPLRAGPSPSPFDPGATHVALCVSDIDRALAFVATHGWRAQGEVQTMNSGPLAGYRLMYIVGPDGEVIEFKQAP